ncbi:hypothetical protein, partial [Serratia marcescens]|uniref:hypothetical protein n=1 Tax=Serratia marcescens TaxID=615 RepID=UPI0028146F65
VDYILRESKNCNMWWTHTVENLLDKEYTTVWGQRAPILYSPTYGSPELYSYKGRGRTFGLNYSVLF